MPIIETLFLLSLIAPQFPIGWREVLVVAAGSTVVSSVVGGVVGYWRGRRKDNADTRKGEAEAIAVENATNETLFHDNRKLRILVSAYETAIDVNRQYMDELRDENADLKQRLSDLGKKEP